MIIVNATSSPNVSNAIRVASSMLGNAAPMCISSRELHIDLISLDMKDYDVILGMDFLVKYGASIDCHRRKVVFQPDGEEAFEFLGAPKKNDKVLLSALEARKLIHDKFETYLAHVVDKKSENQVQFLDVPIVRDFTDMFSEDLLGLPLDHEIEFEIKLAPGTGPISKSPCRMTPS